MVKKQGQKRDLERELAELEQNLSGLTRQTDDIDKRIVLKKRYVLNQNSRGGSVNDSKN